MLGAALTLRAATSTAVRSIWSVSPASTQLTCLSVNPVQITSQRGMAKAGKKAGKVQRIKVTTGFEPLTLTLYH